MITTGHHGHLGCVISPSGTTSKFFFRTALNSNMTHLFFSTRAHYYPNKPNVDYPDGFQKNQIPVHAASLARLIEDRVEGKI